MMEEQQIQIVVHQIALERQRGALLTCERMQTANKELSPRVAQILACLMPYLASERRPVDASEQWWHA